jgi:glycosyltransferase involved in cell wall biosynthesis
MKIAYLSASTIPSRFANSVHVMKMCQAFANNGHEVTLYSYAGKEIVKDDYDNYGVERCFEIIKSKLISLYGIGGLLYAIGVVRKIRKHSQPDLLYARHNYSLAVSSFLGIPMIFEAHSPPGSIIRRMAENWVFKHKNFVRLVVISNALKQEYQRLFPYLKHKMIMVAHDGADFPSDNISLPEDIFGESDKRIQIGYVGHLYPGRGVELIANLASNLPNINFHIVGGTDEDINHWKQIFSEKNLNFHGYVPHKEVFRYYKYFDIVLAPYQNKVTLAGGKGDTSRWMSPLKIFEYMSAGKAMIASDFPVLREVLRNGENCILCPSQDLDAWKSAILKLAYDKELRFAISNKARQDFLTYYQWSARAKRVIAKVTIT